jgi:hypothetical protein
MILDVCPDSQYLRGLTSSYFKARICHALIKSNFFKILFGYNFNKCFFKKKKRKMNEKRVKKVLEFKERMRKINEEEMKNKCVENRNPQEEEVKKEKEAIESVENRDHQEDVVKIRIKKKQRRQQNIDLDKLKEINKRLENEIKENEKNRNEKKENGKEEESKNKKKNNSKVAGWVEKDGSTELEKEDEKVKKFKSYLNEIYYEEPEFKNQYIQKVVQKVETGRTIEVNNCVMSLRPKKIMEENPVQSRWNWKDEEKLATNVDCQNRNRVKIWYNYIRYRHYLGKGLVSSEHKYSLSEERKEIINSMSELTDSEINGEIDRFKKYLLYKTNDFQLEKDFKEFKKELKDAIHHALKERTKKDKKEKELNVKNEIIDKGVEKEKIEIKKETKLMKNVDQAKLSDYINKKYCNGISNYISQKYCKKDQGEEIDVNQVDHLKEHLLVNSQCNEKKEDCLIF